VRTVPRATCVRGLALPLPLSYASEAIPFRCAEELLAIKLCVVTEKKDWLEV